MSWQTVRILLLHEFRMLLRDRRTVVLAVVLPVLAMPLMLLSARIMHERRLKKLEGTEYKFAIAGVRSAWLRELITRAKALPMPPVDDDEENVSDLSHFKFWEVSTKDPAGALKAGDIHFYLEIFTGAEADALARTEAKQDQYSVRKPVRIPGPIFPEEIRLPGVPLVRIYFRANRDTSSYARQRIQTLLQLAQRDLVDRLLEENRFPSRLQPLMSVDSSSVAGAAEVTASRVGRFLTLALLMFMLSGGSVAAMDIIAGEKERGSLETLLTTSVRRTEIVAAKQLAILAVALAITLIQVLNFLVYVTFKIVTLPKDFVVELPPIAIGALLLLFLPLAAFVASVLLMISAYAKSYKEAQLYFFPVYLLRLVPALAAGLPGITLRSAVALVPLANVSVAAREILIGRYDWPMISVTFVTMLAAALWLMRASARMLSQERLISPNEMESADLAGGPDLFPKHVLRWYAVLGVILFAVALNIPQLATFRRQLLFNEGVIFLGGPLLMILKYRLSFRDALALRPVKPVVWLAVIFMIPSGNILAAGVFRLADLIIPVPKQMIEQFSRELMPPDIPTWQLALFLSILPGICEEIGFRGTLLYGLHRKYKPVSLTLIVGLIFGLFHVSLFRIIPTGFLGVILTMLALTTGSIFPGMLLHAGNNAFALWAGQAGIPIGSLDWRVYIAAAAIFGLSYYIIYRNRSPYPGLRIEFGN